jgi:excisionase family DNA binding protein
METEILTTTQTAKLLGVSVRTAQLLIEGGALASWKTPGGHRRVYRSDVLAFRERKKTAPTEAIRSARVVLLTSQSRSAMLEDVLGSIDGSQVETYTNIRAASFSIESRIPAALVVDLAEEAAERISFLKHVASERTNSPTKLIAVVDRLSVAADFTASRLDVTVANPRQLADLVRVALQDGAPAADQFPEPPSFPLAVNEGQRLAALQRSGLLNPQRDETFDEFTWLARRNLNAPISLMTLLTPAYQLFKSRHGLDMAQTPRSWAFCNFTILRRTPFIVEDLSRDLRFASNPAVVGSPHFRFYAGAPVVDSDGFALGSLCVIDYQPRALNADQERALRILAKLASGEVQSRASSSMAVLD